MNRTPLYCICRTVFNTGKIEAETSILRAENKLGL